MSELESSIKVDSIRGQMNLIFASMKMLTSILELAPENQMAREAISATAESVWAQSAVLHNDVQNYLAALRCEVSKRTSA